MTLRHARAIRFHFRNLYRMKQANRPCWTIVNFITSKSNILDAEGNKKTTLQPSIQNSVWWWAPNTILPRPLPAPYFYYVSITWKTMRDIVGDSLADVWRGVYKIRHGKNLNVYWLMKKHRTASNRRGTRWLKTVPNGPLTWTPYQVCVKVVRFPLT